MDSHHNKSRESSLATIPVSTKSHQGSTGVANGNVGLTNKRPSSLNIDNSISSVGSNSMASSSSSSASSSVNSMNIPIVAGVGACSQAGGINQSINGASSQFRCYLCDTPKNDYSLVRSFSEIVCRGCVNFEGPDQVEKEINRARSIKLASLSPSNCVECIRGSSHHTIIPESRIDSNIKPQQPKAQSQPTCNKQQHTNEHNEGEDSNNPSPTGASLSRTSTSITLSKTSDSNTKAMASKTNHTKLLPDADCVYTTSPLQTILSRRLASNGAMRASPMQASVTDNQMSSNKLTFPSPKLQVPEKSTIETSFCHLNSDITNIKKQPHHRIQDETNLADKHHDHYNRENLTSSESYQRKASSVDKVDQIVKQTRVPTSLTLEQRIDGLHTLVARDESTNLGSQQTLKTSIKDSNQVQESIYTSKIPIAQTHGQQHHTSPGPNDRNAPSLVHRDYHRQHQNPNDDDGVHQTRKEIIHNNYNPNQQTSANLNQIIHHHQTPRSLMLHQTQSRELEPANTLGNPSPINVIQHQHHHLNHGNHIKQQAHQHATGFVLNNNTQPGVSSFTGHPGGTRILLEGNTGTQQAVAYNPMNSQHAGNLLGPNSKPPVQPAVGTQSQQQDGQQTSSPTANNSGGYQPPPGGRLGNALTNGPFALPPGYLRHLESSGVVSLPLSRQQQAELARSYHEAAIMDARLNAMNQQIVVLNERQQNRDHHRANQPNSIIQCHTSHLHHTPEHSNSSASILCESTGPDRITVTPHGSAKTQTAFPSLSQLTPIGLVRQPGDWHQWRGKMANNGYGTGIANGVEYGPSLREHHSHQYHPSLHHHPNSAAAAFYGAYAIHHQLGGHPQLVTFPAGYHLGPNGEAAFQLSSGSGPPHSAPMTLHSHNPNSGHAFPALAIPLVPNGQTVGPTRPLDSRNSTTATASTASHVGDISLSSSRGQPAANTSVEQGSPASKSPIGDSQGERHPHHDTSMRNLLTKPDQTTNHGLELHRNYPSGTELDITSKEATFQQTTALLAKDSSRQLGALQQVDESRFNRGESSADAKIEIAKDATENRANESPELIFIPRIGRADQAHNSNVKPADSTQGRPNLEWNFGSSRSTRKAANYQQHATNSSSKQTTASGGQTKTTATVTETTAQTHSSLGKKGTNNNNTSHISQGTTLEPENRLEFNSSDHPNDGSGHPSISSPICVTPPGVETRNKNNSSPATQTDRESSLAACKSTNQRACSEQAATSIGELQLRPRLKRIPVTRDCNNDDHTTTVQGGSQSKLAGGTRKSIAYDAKDSPEPIEPIGKKSRVESSGDSLGLAPVKCHICGHRIGVQDFVQCPSNTSHKFCFPCSKNSIQKQQDDHHRSENHPNEPKSKSKPRN